VSGAEPSGEGVDETMTRPAGPAPIGGRADSVFRNPGVVGIGVASLLSDTGHEMATAALPGFLRTIGAPAAALGLIEGVADSALSLSKLAGGAAADRPGVERRSLAAGGYVVTAVGHGAFGLAGGWPAVALARAVSWVARGGKAPARDSLLAGSVRPDQLGRAFGWSGPWTPSGPSPDRCWPRPCWWRSATGRCSPSACCPDSPPP
jgi:hypothetical protein